MWGVVLEPVGTLAPARSESSSCLLRVCIALVRLGSEVVVEEVGIGLEVGSDVVECLFGEGWVGAWSGYHAQ